MNQKTNGELEITNKIRAFFSQKDNTMKKKAKIKKRNKIKMYNFMKVGSKKVRKTTNRDSFGRS